MTSKALTLAACLFLAATAAQAAPAIVRTGATAAPIAASVEVPAGSDIVYLSGNTPLVVVLREALAIDNYHRKRAKKHRDIDGIENHTFSERGSERRR